MAAFAVLRSLTAFSEGSDMLCRLYVMHTNEPFPAQDACTFAKMPSVFTRIHRGHGFRAILVLATLTRQALHGSSLLGPTSASPLGERTLELPRIDAQVVRPPGLRLGFCSPSRGVTLTPWSEGPPASPLVDGWRTVLKLVLSAAWRVPLR